MRLPRPKTRTKRTFTRLGCCHCVLFCSVPLNLLITLLCFSSPLLLFCCVLFCSVCLFVFVCLLLFRFISFLLCSVLFVCLFVCLFVWGCCCFLPDAFTLTLQPPLTLSYEMFTGTMYTSGTTPEEHQRNRLVSVPMIHIKPPFPPLIKLPI